jgi:hypothetical protein
MSKLSALLLLVCLFAAPARACKPAHGSEYYNDADNVGRADIIFVAHITRVDEVPGDAARPTTLLATYRLVESVKGDVSRIGTIGTSYSNCHIGLLPGGEYVLFAERDQNGSLTAMPAHTGSRQYLPRVAESIEYLNTIKHLASKKTSSHP